MEHYNYNLKYVDDKLTTQVIDWVSGEYTTLDDICRLKYEIIKAQREDFETKYYLYLIYNKENTKILNVFLDNSQATLRNIDLFQSQNSRVYRLYKVASNLVIEAIDERIKMITK